MGFFKRIKKQIRRSTKRITKSIRRTVSKVELEQSRLTKKGKARVKSDLERFNKQIVRGIKNPGKSLASLSPVLAVDRLQRRIFGGARTSKGLEKVVETAAVKVAGGLAGVGFFSDLFGAATSSAGVITSGSIAKGIGGLVGDLGKQLVAGGVQQIIQKNPNVGRLFGGPGTTGRAGTMPVALPGRFPVQMGGFGAGLAGGAATDLLLRGGKAVLDRSSAFFTPTAPRPLATARAPVLTRGASMGRSFTSIMRATHPHTPHASRQLHIDATVRNLQAGGWPGARAGTSIGEVMMMPDGSTHFVHKKKRRRMNPLNPRALNRSFRRIEGFVKAVKRAKKLSKRVKF